MRKVMLSIALALMLLTLGLPSVKASLFIDGAKIPAGKSLAIGASQFARGLAYFMLAISRWEHPVPSHGKLLTGPQRNAFSTNAYTQFLTELNAAKTTFSAIPHSLYQLPVRPSEQALTEYRNIGGPNILAAYKYNRPRTLGDIIRIATKEATFLLNAAQSSAAWHGKLQDKRKLSLRVTRQMYQALQVGLVIGIFSRSVVMPRH